MPPRRKASSTGAVEPTPPLQQIQPRSSRPSRTSSSSSSLATTKQTKSRVVEPPASSSSDNDDDDEDDQEEEEDIKPIITKPSSRSTRTSRSSLNSNTTTSQTTTTTSRSTRARTSNASTVAPAPAAPASKPTSSSRGFKSTKYTIVAASAAPTSKAKAGGRASRTSRVAAVVAESESSDAEDEAEEQQIEEESSEEEEEEVVKKKVVGGKKGRRSLVPSSPARDRALEKEDVVEEEESEEEEEEDVKPVVGKGRRGVVKKVVPVVAEEEEEDEDDDEEEEVIPVKKTPIKNSRAGKRVIVESSDEAEEEVEDAPTPAQEEPTGPIAEDETPVASSDEDEVAAAELLPPAAVPSTPQKTPSSPTAVKVPAVVPTPAPAVLAPTAYDLTAAARQAAMNHAAMEKEREKEREGKPRLVIHQLVLEDFKSYRGRGVIGPFHKSFSSIVGPNGSGKSNTIDALLFVFGYRATKMRQGKLSELIHNSGAIIDPSETVEGDEVIEGAEFEDSEDEDSEDYDVGKKKKKGGKGKGGKGKGKKDGNYGGEANQAGLIGSCTVEVWFREIIDLPGRDDFTVVPNSQLIVARTAYRNNSSRYTLNGKTSSFTEVTTLLKARGIDLDHKRFLILQGEVESIAQMKPKGATEHDEGLLEYLEDIIGTSKYKKEIETAVVEVDRLNDARGVQLNRVKLVEREKSALEGRKKECDVYLRDQNELVHNQSALFQYNIHQADQNSKVHKEAVTAAEEELVEEIEAQKGTRKEVEGLQAEFDELSQDTKETEKATSEIVKHLSVLDRSDVQRQEKKKSATAKIKKLKKSLSEDSHAKSEADTWVRNHGETIERVGKEVEKMEGTLEKEEVELEKVRDGLKGKTEVFSTQIETLQQDLQPWASQIVDKQAQIDLVSNERDLLMEKSEGVKKAIEDAQATLEKLGKDDESKKERLEELEGEKEEVEGMVKALQGQLDGMQAEDTKLRTKASVARQKADEAKASQSASRSQGNVLSSLTKLKEQGRLPGFHGRLGNLGRIDDKYDVAISTAAPGLDNLVTDTVAVGQSCIDHLRKNNLGRATILCIDRIASRDMSKIQTPESALRLFDLVTPKDIKFAPIFYQVLKDTLVADDMEQGKRLAFGSTGKRWRVVTLDGQLIEASGTMSGGGGRPAKGRMSNKIAAEEVSPEMVARCEQDQKVAVEELRVFVEDRSKVEKDLGGLRKRLPEIEVAISKIEMDLKTSDKRVEEAQKRLAELKTQSKPEAGDVKKITQFEKDIVSLTKDLTKLNQQTETIEDQIRALQDKILEVGGVKLRGQQTKVQDLKAQIDLATDRLTKAEVGKAKSEKDATKLAKTIEANTLALENCQTELEGLVEEIENGAAEVEAVRASVEQAQEVLAEKKEEMLEMKKVLDEKLAIVTQFRKRELELTQHRDAEKKLLDTSIKEVTYWTQKLEGLELNDLDDDDDDEEAAAAPAAEKPEGEAPVVEGEEAEEEQKAEKPAKLDSVLRVYEIEELADMRPQALMAKIAALEERISKTNIDLSVLKEYARREKEFMQRALDLDMVTKERDAAKALADGLRGQRLKEFMEGFGIISMKLKEMYQMITLGGNAELELVDSLDPFSEGIVFSVMPPKKSWKNICNLSGGEKTLSSLALVFALHVFKPTPLYFMDEIDAALDFRNVSIVANYIKDRTKNAQFIIISLRNNMFELSSRLIGIYKVQNQTRSVAIDNKDLSTVQDAPTPLVAAAPPVAVAV